MPEQVKCPFCENSVDSDAEKCSSCGAFFTEPQLKEIKFKDFGIFFALQILTFGLFAILWVFINFRAINNLTVNPRDSLKFKWLAAILGISIIGYIGYILSDIELSHRVACIVIVIQHLIGIALSYRILKIIQRYTLNRYDVMLELNPYYIIIFSVLYMSHFIDTYSKRVMNSHEHFSFKSPQGVALLILLAIIAALAGFYYHLNSINSPDLESIGVQMLIKSNFSD